MPKGNRPLDVCALCDRVIECPLCNKAGCREFPGGYASLHLYVGKGWVHGGGRENIACHLGCLLLGELPDDAPHYGNVIRAVGFV